MIERTAHVVVCDDLRVEIGGKFILVGMYTGNLAIPVDEIVAPQLVFLFLVSTELDDPFLSLTFEITFPGSELVKQEGIFANPPIPISSEFAKQGATRLIHRIPVTVFNPTIRPGRIETKVIHEKGEIEVIGAPFIIKGDPFLLNLAANAPEN